MTPVKLPGVLATSQAPSGLSHLVEISALTTCEGPFDLNCSHCPVWALSHYLKHVSVICGSWQRLFLKLDHSAMKEIHANHISKRVWSVVSDAYASAKGGALPVGLNCAYEMRALASS